MATELRRAIKRWEVVALTINVVVGGGIFGLPATLFREAGAWSLVGLVICAVLVTLLNLALVELSGKFTATGGPYVYATAAYGNTVGFVVGWSIWLMRVTAMAVILILFCDHAAGVIPAFAGGAPRVALVIGVVAALTALNLAGVRTATTANNVFTIGKLVPLIALAAIGLAFVQPDKLELATPVPTGDIARAAFLCVFTFTGFETATILAGEMRDPRRDLPFALLTTTAIVTLLYGALLVVAISTVPGLATSQRPLADAAAQIAGSTGVAIVTAGAMISLFGILLALATAAPRVLFAMGEAKELPSQLAHVHPRRGTPDVAVVISAILVLALALSGTFSSIMAVSTLIRLVTYALVAVAVLVLRRRDGRGLWRGPAGIPIVAASLVLTVWMLKSVHTDELLVTAGLAGAGLVVRFLAPRLRA